MQTIHIISAPKGTTVASFGSTSLATRDREASADNEPAPAWLLAALQHMNANSATDFRAKAKVRDLLEQSLTQGAALQIQQELMQQIQEAELIEKEWLRNALVQLFRDHPDFFAETSVGRQEMHSFWSVITCKDATWARLNTEYTRAKAAVDVWWCTKGLVERAIVDSETLQRNMRRAARDPNMTAADEQAVVQQLVSKLLVSMGDSQSNWPLLNAFQHLHEALLDPKDPKQLAATMLDTVVAYATS